MMRPLLVFIFFIYSLLSTAQSILWEKSYGGKHAEFLYDAIPTPDYGFILAGSSISNKNGNKTDDSKGNLDYWVWKMNANGELDWQKSFGGSGVDLLQSIQLTRDAGFILAGTSTSTADFDKKNTSKGGADYWIIKLDATGNEMWQKTIGGSGDEKLQSLLQTPDGGYIIAGSSSSDATPEEKESLSNPFYGKTEDSRGNLDYWVVKLTKEGTIAWQKTIGGLYVDELKSVALSKDGGYVLGGYSNSPASGDKLQDNMGIGDYWIVKLDTSGTIVWQKTIGGDQDDNLFALIATKDGGYVAGGNSNSGSSGSKSKANGKGTDFWVVKLDDQGSMLWQETYDFGKIDVLNSVVENPDGTLLLGGYAQSEVASRASATGNLRASATDKEGINDYIALKISATGESLWNKIVGSKGEDVLKKLIETRDGGYLLAGTSNGGNSRDKSSGIGGTDFWVVKLKDTAKPEKLKTTIEALPNPVESFTNIVVNFDYTEGTATLYDLNGRRLQSQKITGSHTIPMQLNGMPAGVYIVSIQTNTQEESIKVIKK